jgi:hypothetical protein
MRHLYFFGATAALCGALAIPGRLSAQAAPAAQTVTCKDGSSAEKGQGACSHHGGVVRMVTCKDGSTAKKGRGACSHHGGMAARARARAKTSTGAGATAADSGSGSAQMQQSDTSSMTGRSSAAGAKSNQTKSGVTDTRTGKSTLGTGVTKTSPDQGPPVTAKGDTLSRGDSTSSGKR